MIVKNEAHIIREALDAVAPYITSWVIVDTGSDDGTQDVIRSHMAGLGIPGELCERPWRNFGHNRTEALTLAQGRGDYIWVMDADDTVIGTPDFNHLDADVYFMRVGQAPAIDWRAQLFRDGARVRYVGVVHECAVWDDPYVNARLEGEYHIESRRLGSRSQDPQKLVRDRDLLLAEVERNPEHTRPVYYLAQSYFDLKDFANARKWYARRVEMGGWDQEVYYSMFRLADSMAQLDTPWAEVQEAYLRAWEFRPTRAEALYFLAFRCRATKRHQLGYMFAKRAAQIPLPEDDILLVHADIHAWLATEEQATCAWFIGKHAEAFTLWRRVLARPDIPDEARQRIAGNRDFSVPAMLEAASSYPDALVGSLVAGPRDTEVTVSLVAGPDRAATEQTLNSFLHCCTDVSRVGRFLVLDTGLSAQDRTELQERYGFLEFVDADPGAAIVQIREHVQGRFWLHLRQNWRFFAPENLISRLTAVLDAEPQVFQVGINFADAAELTGASAAEQQVRRTPDAGRYVLTSEMATGPAMFDTARLDQAGSLDRTDPDPITTLGQRATTAGPHTASLDEVLCTTARTLPDQVQRPAQPNQVGNPQQQPQAHRRETNSNNNGAIFICGAQRSGNTLMRAMLDSHPRICCGQELKVLPRVAQLYRQISGPYRFVMESYDNTLSDVQSVFRGFVEGLVENYRRAEGKPRWAEKTPQNVGSMVELGEIFPEAKFIHMLRDGRDVACSLITQEWRNPETGVKVDFVKTMSAAARHWRDVVMLARKQAAHPSLNGRVLEVRYEALVTETAPTMRQVLAFLGEEWDEAVLSHHTKDRQSEQEQAQPEMQHILKPVDQSALSRWQRDMTELDKAAFKAEAGALLTELGYASADW
jgi:glycosyltransferase involved in cell wall biosynthesis